MSQLECAKCHGRSTLYLCSNCTDELRKQFLRLPTMCDYLLDAANGQTNLGDDQRGPVGFGSQSPPPVDHRAAQLLEDIHNTIGQWARSMARTHALMISPPVTWHRPWDKYTYTTKDYALFLAPHVDKLAKDPDVGELVADLKSYVHRAVGGRDYGGVIQRPVPPQFCGTCSTLVTDHRRCVDPDGTPTCSKRDHECATQLMAARGAIEVRCPVCGVTRRTEALVNTLLARSDDYRCTIPEMYRILRMLRTPVELRTLYHWANPKIGILKPAGYLRPDGRRIAPTRHDDKDKPVYRVSAARKAREDSAKPGRRGRPLKSEGKQAK